MIFFFVYSALVLIRFPRISMARKYTIQKWYLKTENWMMMFCSMSCIDHYFQLPFLSYLGHHFSCCLQPAQATEAAAALTCWVVCAWNVYFWGALRASEVHHVNVCGSTRSWFESLMHFYTELCLLSSALLLWTQNEFQPSASHYYIESDLKKEDK